jgi:hypothetical protein
MDIWPHFFYSPWKYLSNVVSNYLFRCYLLLQTHDIYEHFRKHSWHFCHNSSNLSTSRKQLCFQHANIFQEPSNDSRSLILTRFDIWNFILKIWDSSPQKKNLTWNLEKFFFNSHTCPILCGKMFHPYQLTSCLKFKFNQKNYFPLS